MLNLAWLPAEQRAAAREPRKVMAEGDHYPYFITLEQDYETMPRQQRGLKNNGLGYMALTRQEIRLAYFHSVVDSWLEVKKPING
ncbi:SRPBCC family protein [Sphingobium sp. DEHP117]|uniref:SRPBCC family protein n=1 Tax=Sphingobium sp. DEHP117 TaxID=2993436 RepID=UPI00359FA76E